MLAGRAWLGRDDVAVQLQLHGVRQYRAQVFADFQQWLEQARVRHQCPQALAHQSLAAAARHSLIDHGAADIQQVVIVDAGRAGGFAVTA
ncbi:hypothetical protein D3C86_1840100 [compost metagenome]